jgi:uncharacterized protein YjbI with pentapeptide repeats
MPQDFSKKDFRGKSFIKQDLSQYDFSNADIRGANFTNCLLVSKNFSNAKTGLKLSWIIILICIILLLTIIAGVMIGYGGGFPAFIMSIKPENISSQVVWLLISTGFLILITFFVVVLKQGIGAGLGIFSIIIVMITAMIGIFGQVGHILAQSLIQSLMIAITIAGVLLGSLLISVSWLVAGIKLLIPVVMITTLWTVLGLLEVLFGTLSGSAINSSSSASILFSCLLIVSLLALSSYIGFRAIIKDDPKYRLIRQLAINITSLGATSFREANLTDADFTQANLKHTDFRKANLTRTCWFESKNLDLARIENAYLENPKIRQLVTTKNGEDQDFSNCDLRGLNLKGANLKKADLMGTNLSESSLIGADLTEAIIAKAKLYGVNLSEACLTDACIEGWAISTDLVYDNISCDAIYMKWVPPKKTQDRKPDRSSETFQEGDFADFIFPYIDRLIYYTKADQDPRELGKELRIKTIDLYHSSEFNEFNSSAALIALKELAEENPKAELEIVSLRVLGQEKVHLKIAVKGEGDCNQLSENYWIYYKKYNKLPKQEIQQKIEEISRDNDKFANLFSIFTLPRGDSIINVSVGRDISGVLNIGTITGNVSNVIN